LKKIKEKCLIIFTGFQKKIQIGEVKAYKQLSENEKSEMKKKRI
jgi:hypothetical protein